MHVIQDGNLIEGAEVFLIIWKNIPKYNFLYKVFNNKPMFFLLKIFYEIAAYFLFLKNPRLAMMVRVSEKMNKERKTRIFKAANNFIKENTNG